MRKTARLEFAYVFMGMQPRLLVASIADVFLRRASPRALLAASSMSCSVAVVGKYGGIRACLHAESGFLPSWRQDRMAKYVVELRAIPKKLDLPKNRDVGPSNCSTIGSCRHDEKVYLICKREIFTAF
jgi:hypothetical protein